MGHGKGCYCGKVTAEEGDYCDYSAFDATITRKCDEKNAVCDMDGDNCFAVVKCMCAGSLIQNQICTKEGKLGYMTDCDIGANKCAEGLICNDVSCKIAYNH